MYAYARGISSSREIERRCETDLAFRYLTGGQRPDHDTLCAFRVRHLAAFRALFVDTLRVARESGLKKVGHLSVDGTKMKANASKHKAMSYGRMKEQEQKLKQEIEALLERARATDAQEDARLGVDQAAEEELPAELRRRQERLAKIEQAKARLEARQVEADRERGRYPDDKQRRGDGAGRPFKHPFGVPDDKAQDNFTDPQSRIMKMGGNIEQCYNAQAAVDGHSQLIIANGLTNNAADNGELLSMIEAVRNNLGELPKQILADSGYRSEQAFAALEEQGVKALVALGREGKNPAAIDPESYPASARMAQRLATPEGKAQYRRRKVIPEPVFGWIKHVMGFRQFSLRGLTKVTGEWSLVCLALNVRRMWALQT
jgi:hypothetical protein